MGGDGWGRVILVGGFGRCDRLGLSSIGGRVLMR